MVNPCALLRGASEFMEIKVARHLLPEADQERAEFLKKYFCELVASAEAVDDRWSIRLKRPLDSDFYIDPDLSQGLEWWSSNFGQTDVGGIPSGLYRTRGLQLSLNDSWTLYSWSNWLREKVDPSNAPPSITLLHLDDHDDLMTPRVVIEGEAFHDLVTGYEIDLWQPETVAAAITSGAVGIGSFMAPMLHKFRSVEVRHLCSTEYTKDRQGAYVVCPVIVPDDLLAPGSRRLGLQLKRVDDLPTSLAMGHPYIVTDDLHHWLNDLPDGPVLVHIDMDYFNNRFNGDSDWVDYGPKYDPPLADVLARIDSLFESLKDEGVDGRVVDFAVALSPGFFPADLWAPSIERIQRHVRALIPT